MSKLATISLRVLSLALAFEAANWEANFREIFEQQAIAFEFPLDGVDVAVCGRLIGPKIGTNLR